MLEPFIWMFKTGNFKMHFLQLFSIVFIFWIPLAILLLVLNQLGLLYDLIPGFLFKIAVFIVIILPFLALNGYFWVLTENIISRDTEIASSSVFNGKLNTINKISLPDWNLSKFIWRGIASIVASIILYLPIYLIISVLNVSVTSISNFWGFSISQVEILFKVSVIIAYLLIPALLWNYARRDSIVAVLNIPKAVYIITEYPLRYIRYIISYVLVSIIHSLIVIFIAVICGLAEYQTIAGGYSILHDSVTKVFPLILFAFGIYIVSLYFLFVYSYLLGTLAPECES